MGRFRRHIFEDDAREFSTDESYNIAYKKVKRVKGFYSHLKVYFIVNVIIIISSLNRDFIGNRFQESGLLDLHTYYTAFYWGLGVLIHAFSVFGRDVFFSSDWEQKKIQKIMEKEKENTNKWE
nr:2TM domain-containing protein [uncultured Flavobacterium sp.]